MKSIHRFLGLFSVLLLTATTGCTDFEFDFEFLTFVNPSVAPEDAEAQTELFGSYTVTDFLEFNSDETIDGLEMEFDSPENKVDSAAHPSLMHVGRAGKGFPDGFLRCVDVSFDSDGEMSVGDSGEPCFASKVGDCYILNVPIATSEKEMSDEDLLFNDDEIVEPRITEWKPENYEGYWLFLLKPTKTGFALHMLDENFIKSEIAAGRLVGRFSSEQQKAEYRKKRKTKKREGKDSDVERIPFLVSEKSKELQAFFVKNPDKLAGRSLMLLERVN